MEDKTFKSVEYAGFGDHPDLKALAVQATQLLTGEIRSWRDQVEVEWEAHAGSAAPAIELTLLLELPDASGTATGYIPTTLFQDIEDVKSRCRWVWIRVLDQVIEKQVDSIKQSTLEAVEV